MVSLALIPAAGRGTRLDRPDTPKPIVDVGGNPLLVNVLQRLEKAGITRAMIVVGYGADQIIRTLTKHPGLSLDLEFIPHPQWRKGLASSILAAADKIDEPFLLTMSDHLIDGTEIRQFVEATSSTVGHQMLVDQSPGEAIDLSRAVKVHLDDAKNQVQDVSRTLDNHDAIDMGLFYFTPTIFEALTEASRRIEPASLTDGIELLAKRGELTAHLAQSSRPWFNIDTPQALIRAEMAHRATRRKESVLRPEFRVEEAPEHSRYHFFTGKPARTEIFIQRGFVRNPDRIQLIPDESASSPIYVFTDTRVNELYGDDFVGGLDRLGYDVRRIVMAEGEESKTLSNYVHLVEHILAEGIDERSVLISLGGGAVCNVCGFIASTLYRGIGLVHVPTTLMAQCDAAISHKQGINGSRGKNLVGSYYPPQAIAVDIEVLATLEDWLIPDGLSEVIKHALGQDPEYLRYLQDYTGPIDDPDFLEYVVRKNIELKCDLVATDPKEHREGMVLQYGHTCGHPVEFLSSYDLNHGQSVAIGMMVAARVAHILGACSEEIVELHREVIEKYELPTTIPSSIKIDDILAAMRYNKRYLTEGTRMALVDGPGTLWSVDDDYAIPVSDEVLREALKATY